MLIGLDGHIKLTDFGLSRYYYLSNQHQIQKGTDIHDLRSYSYCGTEQYMAVWIWMNFLYSYIAWNALAKTTFRSYWLVVIGYLIMWVSHRLSSFSRLFSPSTFFYSTTKKLANSCQYHKSFIHSTSSRYLNGCPITNPSFTWTWSRSVFLLLLYALIS